jgi:hypothetical protein
MVLLCLAWWGDGDGNDGGRLGVKAGVNSEDGDVEVKLTGFIFADQVTANLNKE